MNDRFWFKIIGLGAAVILIPVRYQIRQWETCGKIMSGFVSAGRVAKTGTSLVANTTTIGQRIFLTEKWNENNSDHNCIN